MKKYLFFLFAVFVVSVYGQSQEIYFTTFPQQNSPGGWEKEIIDGEYNWYFGEMVLPGSTLFSQPAAVFSDDAAGSGEYGNKATLTSPLWNVAGYDTVSLSYEYGLNRIGGGGILTVEVYDGFAWQEVAEYDQTQAPTTIAPIDVTAYKNASFRVRFTYYDEFTYSMGAGVTNFLLEGTSAVAPNSECWNAVVLNCGASGQGSTVNATMKDELAAHNGLDPNGSYGVWYKYSDIGNQSDVTFSLCDTTGVFDSRVIVYQGDCADLFPIASNDDACGTLSEVSFHNDGTSSYYILVFGADESTSDFNYSFNCSDGTPPNDDIENAIDVSGLAMPYTDPAVPMINATMEADSADFLNTGCDMGGGWYQNVFYKFTAEHNGTATATFTTPNPGGFQIIGFYTAPNDNATISDLTFVPESGCNQMSNTKSIPITEGTVYYVVMFSPETNSDVVINLEYETTDDNFPAPYCEINGYSNLETISRVLITDSEDNVIIDNSSIASNQTGAAPFHEDFTNVVGNLTAGETYQIAVEGYTGGNYRNSITVFIDWNQDEVFDNVTERYELGVLENSTGTDGQQVTIDVEVPMYAVSGNTRMRVMKRYESFDPPLFVNDACTVGDSFGQAEDYTLNVTGGDEGPQQGCLEVANPSFPQFPTATIIPQCYGTPQILTGGVAYTGEYSMIQVTEGTEYIFSSSNETYFITIGNEEGTEVLAYGTGSVTWTADADRLVRFYTHLDDNCNASTVLHDRILQCGEIPPPPANDNCEDITPVELTNGVPVTFNGTTVGGTGSPEEIALLDYGAVWEAVTLTGECNNLKIDYCGTAEGVMTNSFIVYTDGCGATDYVAGSYEFTSCSDGNITVMFPNLPAGTYYLPVIIDQGANLLGEYTMNVISEDCPPAPVYCDEFEVLSNNLEDGWFFAGNGDQHLATDIQVADQPFTVYGMEPTVIGEASSFEFIIYSDNAGVPGNQLETRTGTILGQEITGSNFGFDFIKYQVEFNSPLALEANTTYWIEVISDAQGWESTSAVGSQIGYDDAYSNVDTFGAWDNTGGSEFVFNLICEELGTNDLNAFDFNYHPNPVKDILNISSKKSVENVSVFNLAGQKVLNNAKVSNNQVDVSALTPGTYVFKVTLEGGQIETFKIIKK